MTFKWTILFLLIIIIERSADAEEKIKKTITTNFQPETKHDKDQNAKINSAVDKCKRKCENNLQKEMRECTGKCMKSIKERWGYR